MFLKTTPQKGNFEFNFGLDNCYDDPQVPTKDILTNNRYLHFHLSNHRYQTIYPILKLARGVDNFHPV